VSIALDCDFVFSDATVAVAFFTVSMMFSFYN
jgi:hypothetical protein